jgi:transcriptional regulator with XRE-family HTH domain
MSFTAAQCRAARALIGWSQDHLAIASKVAKATIANFELGNRAPYPRTLEDIRKSLEAAGVEFTNGDTAGVRLRGWKWSIEFEGTREPGRLYPDFETTLAAAKAMRRDGKKVTINTPADATASQHAILQEAFGASRWP